MKGYIPFTCALVKRMNTDNTAKTSKNFIFLIFAALLVTVSALIPVNGVLSRTGLMVIVIFVSVIYLWVVTDTEWVSFFCLAALAFIPELSMSDVLNASFGSQLFGFLLFTFMCTKILSETPFLRRCSLAILSSRFSSKGPWWFIVMYSASVILIGSFISTTVLTMMYLSINEEIFKLLDIKKGDKFAKLLTVGLIISSNISCGMTPISHVFPPVALNAYTAATGETVSYASYVLIAVPTGIICTALMLLIFRFIINPDFSNWKAIDFDSLKKGLPKAGRKEITVAVIFLIVVFGWLFPGTVLKMLPHLSDFIGKKIDTAFPPLFGCILLLCLPMGKDEAPITPRNALQGMPWAALFMVAATQALGKALALESAGIYSIMQNASQSLAASTSYAAVGVIIIIAWTLLQTNLTSNLVTVTLVASVGIQVALILSGINAKALLACVGMAASFSFCTPAAAVNVPIGIGTGWCSAKDVFKYGVPVMFACLLVLILFSYTMFCTVI